MLMQIKHYRFERMDETTVTFDLLINTDHIIRVNRAVATDRLPAGCEIEYADVHGRISYRIDLTLENFYADYLALNRTQGAAFSYGSTLKATTPRTTRSRLTKRP